MFGTDDPEEVGKKMKDWDTAKATAEELKAKGYYTFASYADTFRLYGNSISQFGFNVKSIPHAGKRNANTLDSDPIALFQSSFH